MFHSEYSYARKYWIKHLSNIPPGNSHILAVLKRFEHEAAETLAAEGIKTVQTWLEVKAQDFGTCMLMNSRD